jgi:hypothetical protein
MLEELITIRKDIKQYLEVRLDQVRLHTGEYLIVSFTSDHLLSKISDFIGILLNKTKANDNSQTPFY